VLSTDPLAVPQSGTVDREALPITSIFDGIFSVDQNRARRILADPSRRF
jgi:hypothetical protein